MRENKKNLKLAIQEHLKEIPQNILVSTNDHIFEGNPWLHGEEFDLGSCKMFQLDLKYFGKELQENYLINLSCELKKYSNIKI